MGLVVSVLEEEQEEDSKGIYGTSALSLSYWYGRGHEKRDLWMMLIARVLEKKDDVEIGSKSKAFPT
ncbi:unnamed protein product [Eruca vesicaria subsp. sativa]|uniref:Uncharacterized protein n=1 Tax=Eruca vesicaria subsp. sativa TaxID=29727 RepID=A0ABC8LU41_ERUVS|nr:unnamed protein product [Eruca vesicaria subsp. sativa]